MPPHSLPNCCYSHNKKQSRDKHCWKKEKSHTTTFRDIYTCGKAVLSCLCRESRSWVTSCSLPWFSPSVSWVSRSVSSNLSLSSSIETISCSKWESESVCRGEPDPWLPFPPEGISASLMVGITSHIIFKRRGPHQFRVYCQII